MENVTMLVQTKQLRSSKPQLTLSVRGDLYVSSGAIEQYHLDRFSAVAIGYAAKSDEMVLVFSTAKPDGEQELALTKTASGGYKINSRRMWKHLEEMSGCGIPEKTEKRELRFDQDAGAARAYLALTTVDTA